MIFNFKILFLQFLTSIFFIILYYHNSKNKRIFYEYLSKYSFEDIVRAKFKIGDYSVDGWKFVLNKQYLVFVFIRIKNMSVKKISYKVIDSSNSVCVSSKFIMDNDKEIDNKIKNLLLTELAKIIYSKKFEEYEEDIKKQS